MTDVTNTVPPSVTGGRTAGATLTANPGSWAPTPSSYTYRWQQTDWPGGTATTVGATGSTYTLASGDAGKYFRVSATPQFTEPAPISGQGYHITFSDDFTTALDIGDQNKWTNNMWYEGDANAGQIVVNNSILELRAGAIGPNVGISTIWNTDPPRGGTSFLYGYFELRARWTNNVANAWPGFWLFNKKNRYGENASSPATSLNAEFDILEGYNIYPSTPITGTLHRNTGDINGVPDSLQQSFENPAADYDTAFHTYAGLWTAGTIAWYFDDTLLNSVAPYDSTPQEMFLIIDMWLTGSTGGANALLEVDWVRAWQQ